AGPRSRAARRGAAAAAGALRAWDDARGRYARLLALAPGDAEARRGLAEAERLGGLAEGAAAREASADAEARGALRPDDLYGRLVRFHRWCAAEPEVQDLAPAAAALRENYDRPLLLAIAGEFNAGKSTLLNALLSHAVAPMGVTPTTAAVNVFVYGTRRAPRVVHRDR